MVLGSLLLATLVVSVGLGLLTRGSAKEILAQTLAMAAAALGMYGIIALL